MLHISKQTTLDREEVLERAARFFGNDGEGLEETERSPCCTSFEGGGGYVLVSIVDEEEGHKRSVDVETREFEYQAKRFLETI
jgi:hypothetical protein